ncbi:TetR/AcrR family transcriptional regulator [uncultured Streptomyces sp.]|uniref:TetR/AcrR family transcriptional regulator n=1 Tax=uncultured Streptomyces sp. TaxID=174707 RepID=UPI0026069CC1|nr:TetR/AcrR family transcriptional regulator [uncultured Streptomyces sp.]
MNGPAPGAAEATEAAGTAAEAGAAQAAAGEGTGRGVRVPDDLVRAALRVARTRGAEVGDVPMQAVAQEAGISRSTLLRRLGGTRHALDEAVRAAGVDPGGQKPVRERAVDAGAALISDDGIAAVSLERIAAVADCSVHSLYAVFGGRDGLLRAIFHRYTPIVDIKEVLAAGPADLRTTVGEVYRRMAAALGREPRVVPALMAEVLARPKDASVRPFLEYLNTRPFADITQWLTAEIDAHRVRDLPPFLLMHQMTSPLIMHLLIRPVAEHVPGMGFPPVEEVCDVFADAFVRAVALPGPVDPDGPAARERTHAGPGPG